MRAKPLADYRTMTNLTPSESQEQATFVEWLDLCGFDYWHTPNSTYTKSWKQKNKNKALGVKPGIPDLFVIVNNRLVGIEMKRAKGGTTSQNQKDWITKLNNAGVETVVCKGADEAIKFIEKVKDE